MSHEVQAAGVDVAISATVVPSHRVQAAGVDVAISATVVPSHRVQAAGVDVVVSDPPATEHQVAAATVDVVVVPLPILPWLPSYYLTPESGWLPLFNPVDTPHGEPSGGGGGGGGGVSGGTASIEDGQSSVAVDHGLGSVPLSVTVTPRSSEPDLWVPSRNDAQFTIQRPGTTGALEADWQAIGGAPVDAGEVEFIASTNSALDGPSSSATSAVPAGTDDGDLLVAHVLHRNSSGVTHPAGWTVVDEGEVDWGQWNVVLVREADNEPADYTWTNGGTRCAAAIIALRNTTGDMEAGNVAFAQGTSQGISSPSVAALRPGALLLSLLCTVSGGGSLNYSAPSEMTLMYGGGNVRLHGAREALSDSGPTGSRFWAESSGLSQSGLGVHSFIIEPVPSP